MIGCLDGTKVFEYRTEEDFIRAISDYVSRYDGDYAIITDYGDIVKGIIADEDFIIRADIQEGESYYIRFYQTRLKTSEIDFPGKNDKLSYKDANERPHKLKVFRAPIPTEIY